MSKFIRSHPYAVLLILSLVLYLAGNNLLSVTDTAEANYAETEMCIRDRYNPVNMLKTIIYGFAEEGYCSFRKLEDNCRVNIRYMSVSYTHLCTGYDPHGH